MAEKKAHPIKEKIVNELAEKMKSSRTIMIVNIRGLPSKQFQDIKKSIREQAQVQVAKKNILRRAIEKVGKESILPLEDYVKENSAFILSDKEGYELAGILIKKKTPTSAKAGQIAPEDIEVKSGPTSLVPGPAISELSSAGLQVSVENGKLSIKTSKIIAHKGEIIKPNVASILQKLNIMPFSVGLEPVAIYDVKEERIYTDIKIDSDAVVASLKDAASKALGFAQKIVYYCRETIGYLLAKANAEETRINLLSPNQLNNPEENA
jgi:large subunit ribosomal protein L10